MTTKEYSAYIKGLTEGLGLDANKPETKVINALCGIIEQMAAEIEVLKDDTKMLHDYIEEIDEDLGAVEELLYEEEDCDCEDDCCCHCENDEDENDDEDFYCAMCPHCGEKIYFDDSVNPEEILCPACQKPLLEEEDEIAEL